jgi:shikimate 5-dehydrogenase
MIDKDTKIFCSFSSNPGNNGCSFFNEAFEQKNINAIYKSFYSDDISKSIEAVKTLDIAGFAISMPFKTEVIAIVDEISSEVHSIGSANTVINTNGYLIAYNTDYLGVKSLLAAYNVNVVYILGNGGFSKAVQYACGLNDQHFEVIRRDEWEAARRLKNQLIFNATPANFTSNDNTVIDGRPFTDDGKKIALQQAKHQFKLYTGLNYE